MSGFECPVENCQTELSRLQVMHFRSKHGCDPVEWVTRTHGDKIRTKYNSGYGSYAIADEYEWLSSDMVTQVVDTRTQSESLAGDTNPMNRDSIRKQFTGKNNPAKRPAVREKISSELTGHAVSEETKEKISAANSGNEISEAHRQAVSEAFTRMDRSYMETAEYSEALSEALTGREPTYPSPYEVDELSHKVRSSWEEAIGRMLVDAEISYQYEPEFKLTNGSYYPDFVTGADVIEVKGWANERSVLKAEQFMTEYESRTYIVVGDEIPSDVHIPWDHREQLLEVLNYD